MELADVSPGHAGVFVDALALRPSQTSAWPWRRDRAGLGTLAGTGVRVGAVAQLRLRDLRDYGEHRALRFREKRGRDREIPLRIDLDRWIRSYLDLVNDEDQPDGPLFRPLSAVSRSRFASGRFLQPWTIRAMLKRRLKDAALPDFITPHSFRAMVVTDLLEAGNPLRRRPVPRRTPPPLDHPDL